MILLPFPESFVHTNINHHFLGTSTVAILVFFSNDHSLYAHLTLEECHASLQPGRPGCSIHTSLYANRGDIDGRSSLDV